MIKIDSQTFQQDAYSLASKIKQDWEKYDGLIIIARWGLHLGYYLADKLKNRNIQILSIETPYSHHHEGYIVHSEPSFVKWKKYLFIDDLIDSGYTLKYIEKNYQVDYDIAVLYIKPANTYQTEKKIFSVKNLPQDWIDFYYESSEEN